MLDISLNSLPRFVSVENAIDTGGLSAENVAELILK